MLKKFFTWMEYNPPLALSADGWDEFNEEFRKDAPIRYFITKKLFPKFRSLGRRIEGVVWWVKYRTTHRFHVIDTGLRPGYNDVDRIMLHANFKLLVDFVEQECAWMELAFDEKRKKEVFRWRARLPRILRNRAKWRDRELGLQHLDWEITLDDETRPPHDRNPGQAKQARDVKKLYLWWTDERPKRKEIPYPLDESPGLEFLSQKWKDANPEKEELVKQWSRDSHIQEEAWREEDTVMLIKLMKIRSGLWT